MTGDRGGALTAQLRCAAPELIADLQVPAGATLGVIGPNGAGKSTLLSIIAGLRRTPDSQVCVGDRMLQGQHRFVEPHRRSVVLLEQKAKLFPHLNVRRNVAFGPASAGLSRAVVRARTTAWLEEVGVADLADRMPRQLSGGQAQRVAIARALAAEPDVLLLDEPFAALDIEVAQRMRTLVRTLLARRTGSTVLVTHDLVDVVSLADTLGVLDAGRLAQIGSTTAVLTHPETDFAASLSGLNLVVGRYGERGTVTHDSALVVIGTASEALVAGAGAAAAFPPRAVALYLRSPTESTPAGSPRNSWAAVVVDVMPRGDHALVRSECAGLLIGAEVTWESVAELGLGQGVAVRLVVKASEIKVYGVAAGSPDACGR